MVAIINSRTLRIVLLLVAIGLLVRVGTEPHSAPPAKSDGAEPSDTGPKTGGAVQKAEDCSSNVDGNGNKVSVNCDDKSKK